MDQEHSIAKKPNWELRTSGMEQHPGLRQTGQRPSLNLITPLEVLRNYFGELPSERAMDSLTVEGMEELGDLLVQSAAVSVFDPVPPGTYYPGGWLGSGWNEPVFKSDLDLALLYYPRLLVHDPLSGYFFDRFDDLPKMKEIRIVSSTTRSHLAATYTGPDVFAQHGVYLRHKDEPAHALSWFRRLVLNVVAFAPLIDSGVLILRSQWPTILARHQAIMTSVRHDVRSPQMQAAATADPFNTTRWDNIRGGKVTIPGGIVHPSDAAWETQDEFLYLAKTLAVADEAGATYVPPNDADFGLVRAKAATGATRIKGLQQQPSKLLEEVARLVVPNLELDAKTALRIRQDEECFDSWRRDLSTLARDSKDDSAEDLACRVDDLLIPRIRDINRALKKSRPLRDNLVPDGAAVAISAGIGLFAAGPAGAAAGAAIGAAPGVFGWLFKAYQRPNLSSSDTVLARLIQKK
ncbi:hypothetical protein [Paenarthrobacter ureafaciens]|uniref:hypothetical protein n=1 Tax=Paenarthrobacter ureafaciens TaxID=37931 RepID=UPI0015B8C82B|nr:hypothetical protein [Paenarthrobacter ureafaciens]